jgi:hypothetical protein
MRQSSDNMNRNLSNNNNNFPLDINTLLCCRFYNEDDYFTNQINESKSEKIISKVDELNCQLNDKKDLFQKDDNLNCLKLFSADRTETVKDKEIMRGEIKNKKHIFVCNREGCEKKYKSKENLNLHIKNKHDMIKPYFCRFCLSRFSHRNGKIIIQIFKVKPIMKGNFT